MIHTFVKISLSLVSVMRSILSFYKIGIQQLCIWTMNLVTYEFEDSNRPIQ